MNPTLLAAAPQAIGPWAHAGWGPGPGIFFLVIPLFWLAVVIVIGSIFGRRWRRAAAARGFGPGSFGSGGYGSYGVGTSGPLAAEQTLSERFARGDIDEVEYRARLEVLRANRGA
jgi:putative membrane protein